MTSVPGTDGKIGNSLVRESLGGVTEKGACTRYGVTGHEDMTTGEAEPCSL